jgi:hypothetical protein
MRFDVGLGAGPEGHRLGSFELLLLPLGTARSDRINAVSAQLPGLACPDPRFGKAEVLDRAETHVVLAAIELIAQEPAFRAAGGNLQI